MSLKRRQPTMTKAGLGSDSGITVLIDADIIAYSCGFAAEKKTYHLTVNGEDSPRASFQYKKDLNQWVKDNGLDDNNYSISVDVETDSIENTLHSVKHLIHTIIEKTNAQYWKLYLTGKENFREDIATILVYKQNREGMKKPEHHQAIRDYLVNVWGAEVVEGYEADDQLAIEQTKSYYKSDPFASEGYCRTVIASIDKDLKQVPGWHYNWNKDEKPVWVSEEEGVYNFYKQLLTGDKVDNIQGIPGIGDKKAEKILEGLETEEEMYREVWRAYIERYTLAKKDIIEQGFNSLEEVIDKVNKEVEENARLLWMIRELDSDGKPVMWEPPV